MGVRGGVQTSGGALLIDQGATATLQNVVMQGNQAAPTGGGIYDEGTLRMDGSTLTGNTVTEERTAEHKGFGASLRIAASGKGRHHEL